MDRYGRLELLLKGMKKKHGDLGKEFLYTEEPKEDRKKVLHRILSLGMDPVPLSKAESYFNYMRDRVKGRFTDEDRRELEEYLRDVLGMENAGIYSFSKRSYGVKVHQIVIDGGDHFIHMLRKCNKRCSTRVGVVVNFKVPPWVNVSRYTALVRFRNGIGELERIELPLEMESDSLSKEVYYSVLSRIRKYFGDVKEEVEVLEHADKGKGFFLLGLYIPGTEADINRLRDIVRRAVERYKGG